MPSTTFHHPSGDSTTKASQTTNKQITFFRTEFKSLFSRGSGNGVELIRHSDENFAHMNTFLHISEGIFNLGCFKHFRWTDRFDLAFLQKLGGCLKKSIRKSDAILSLTKYWVTYGWHCSWEKRFKSTPKNDLKPMVS